MALPRGFGVPELRIEQSSLLFEQSRCAVQAQRADGPGRLVPCGAGEESRLADPGVSSQTDCPRKTVVTPQLGVHPVRAWPG